MVASMVMEMMMIDLCGCHCCSSLIFLSSSHNQLSQNFSVRHVFLTFSVGRAGTRQASLKDKFEFSKFDEDPIILTYDNHP
jgi:hypothetical protein